MKFEVELILLMEPGVIVTFGCLAHGSKGSGTRASREAEIKSAVRQTRNGITRRVFNNNGYYVRGAGGIGGGGEAHGGVAATYRAWRHLNCRLASQLDVADLEG